MNLRTARAGDAEAVARLINQAFAVERVFIDGDRTSADEVRSRLETGEFLVAAAPDGRLVGCIYVESGLPPRGHFGLLAVEPALQGSGLGRRLIADAEERCRANGCSTMEILVVNLREELFPFYRRLGYDECGTAPFPVGPPELKRPCHFIRMRKAL